MAKERNRVSNNKTKEEKEKLDQKTNNLANNAMKDKKSKYTIVKKNDKLDVDINDQNIVPLDLPQNSIPNIIVKVVSLGPVGEPAIIVENKNQSESKLILQINQDNPYIGRYYLDDKVDEKKTTMRDCVEAWLLPLYLTMEGMPNSGS